MTEPDAWRIVKLTYDGKEEYRVFAGWYGGYCGSDSWQMNSGIVAVKDCGTHYDFGGVSGSVYRCYKNCERTTGYMQSVFDHIASGNTETGKIEMVPVSDVLSLFQV